MDQFNEPHPNRKNRLQFDEGKPKKDKGRESISCPPALFPVRTRRVIESFQGRLREGHADDQLHKTEGLYWSAATILRVV